VRKPKALSRAILNRNPLNNYFALVLAGGVFPTIAVADKAAKPVVAEVSDARTVLYSSLAARPIPPGTPVGSVSIPQSDGGPPVLIYSNQSNFSLFFAPGAGVRLGDDVLPLDTARQLEHIEHVCVFSPGPFPFNVQIEVWKDDGTGQAPQSPIPGATCQAIGLPPGTIWDAAASCQFGLSSGIALPGRVWLMLTFSTNEAGWVIADQAEVGFTADFFWRDPPGALGMYLPPTYAGHCGRWFATQLPCVEDHDCDDFNMCTTDRCFSGKCQSTPVTNGTPCDDTNICTDETCVDGACVSIDNGACPICVCQLFADIVEPFCLVELGEILYFLGAYGSTNPALTHPGSDVIPCGKPDGIVELGEILAVLGAYAGDPPCPDPSPCGACCAFDGCSSRTPSVCSDLSGSFQGEPSSCDSGVCQDQNQCRVNADGDGCVGNCPNQDEECKPSVIEVKKGDKNTPTKYKVKECSCVKKVNNNTGCHAAASGSCEGSCGQGQSCVKRRIDIRTFKCECCTNPCSDGPRCDCYLYYDDSSGCPPNSATPAACPADPGGCIPEYGNRPEDGANRIKLLDGKCPAQACQCGNETNDELAYAMDDWLRAVETVAEYGAGPVDPGLVAAAYDWLSSDGCLQDLRLAALGITVYILGDSPHHPHHTGHGFLLPIYDWLPPDGFVRHLDSTRLAVFSHIRKAVFDEIRDPGRGFIDDAARSLPLLFPEFQTVGWCQYPHPEEHGHEFYYADGFECLATEIGAIVKWLLHYE